jgi:hypothetical protein
VRVRAWDGALIFEDSRREGVLGDRGGERDIGDRRGPIAQDFRAEVRLWRRRGGGRAGRGRELRRCDRRGALTAASVRAAAMVSASVATVPRSVGLIRAVVPPASVSWEAAVPAYMGLLGCAIRVVVWHR